jgi:metallo-beta-lactamase class B
MAKAGRTLILPAALAASVLFRAPLPAQERGSQDAGFSLGEAAQASRWSEPAEPFKVVGPIHFVGTAGLGVYLLTTPAGHIVLNSGMPGSGPLIEASIRKLGLKPEDVKVLLACHAHVDHVGGHAYLKKLSGAQVAMMEAEAELLRSGGRADFRYGSIPEFRFEPVVTDRALKDGEAVTLGGLTLTAHHTPGHTRGTTTWTTTVTDAGKSYRVVFADGTSVNPGYRLTRDPSYPGIADDYRRTFRVLESLAPDIWLVPHLEIIDLAGKRARAATEGTAAFVDPAGYRSWVAARRATFEAALAGESGTRP